VARILFALQDAGAGHRRVASALAERLRALTALDATTVIDLPNAVRTPLLRSAPRAYDRVATSRPHLKAFDLAFALTNSQLSCETLGRIAARSRLAEVTDLVSREAPDLAVVTHPLFLSDMLAAARARASMSFPIATVVSDPVNPHASWATTGSDFVFATTEQAASQLGRFGRSDVTIVDFPVGLEFTRSCQPTEAARQLLNLEAGAFTVLVMGGGCGAGSMSRQVRSIAERRPEAQLIVLCGRNEKLRQSLQSAPWRPAKSRILGFVENAVDYMDAADVIVTKAGPSTIFEAAHRRRELIITEERGIQERGNGALVCRNNWGWTISNVVELASAIASTEPRSRREARADPGDGGDRLVQALRRLV